MELVSLKTKAKQLHPNARLVVEGERGIDKSGIIRKHWLDPRLKIREVSHSCTFATLQIAYTAPLVSLFI